MRKAVILLSLFLLSACDGASFLTPQKKAVNQISVTADQVTLRAPEGFCVDPKSTTQSAGQAFVVFGNCAAISGNAGLPQPFIEAIATVSVLPRNPNEPSISQSGENLVKLFKTDQGKAILSRANSARTVSVLDSFSRNGAVFVHARDVSGGGPKGISDTYWRGYFDVKGSVVAMSVIGTDRSPVSSQSGLQTLYDFLNATRAKREN